MPRVALRHGHDHPQSVALTHGEFAHPCHPDEEAAAQEPAGGARPARQAVDGPRPRRRRRVPAARQGDPREGGAARRRAVPHRRARRRRRDRRVVHADRSGGDRARRVHLRRAVRPGRVRAAGDHARVRDLAVPASVERARQHPHRHRHDRAHGIDQRTLPRLRRAAAADRRLREARARRRHRRLDHRAAAHLGRHRDARDAAHRRAARALDLHHHEDPAEPHRVAPARALRLPVRRPAAGCRRARGREGRQERLAAVRHPRRPRSRGGPVAAAVVAPQQGPRR